jgi:hypothetical protein
MPTKKKQEKIIEWYKRERLKIDQDRQSDIKSLDKILAQKQEKCEHKWERHENLLYHLGETYPGDLCTECGLTRHPIKRK